METGQQVRMLVRNQLNDAMVLLLPLIHQICTQSELSVTIQKQILKIFFALKLG